MKKTFKFFCVCAMALAAVSCYDDSGVLQRLDELDAKVAKLQEDLNKDVANLAALQSGLTEVTGSVETLDAAIKALEESLGTKYQELLTKLDAFDGEVDGYIADVQAAVASLQKADADLDAKLVAELAKVAVSKVEEVDGKVVLTLADGSKVELSKPLSNVDNNGLVTIVEEDGVKYWAVVGQEGHTGVPVGHPQYSIEFRVNAETSELEYSVNAGEWVATGVKADAENAAIVTDFVDGEDYVEIVINDVKIVLPKYVTDESELELARADFFLRYEGTKKVEVFADGVEECFVAAKPNGWKAVYADGFLTVTAPTKAAVEIGAAETEGEIVLHGTTAAGACKVVKLSVTSGPGLTLSVDVLGNIVVNNAYYGESTDMWGETSFGFSDFVFGLATPEDFHADPKAYVETYNSTWSAPNGMDIIFPSFYNAAPMGEYVEGEYEVDVVKYSVAEAYYMFYYDELPAGSSYVVWVAPVDGDGKAVVDGLLYADYVNIKWDVAVKSVTHNSITLSLDVAGASSFIIGYVPESAYNNDYTQMTFEEYLVSPMGGPWTYFTKYGAADQMGLVVPVESIPEELNLGDVYGELLSAGENYKFWVMPLFDHLVKLDEAQSYPEYDYYVYDYSGFDLNQHFMPFVLEATTNELQPGGDYTAALELESNSFTEIHVNVTPSEGTESVFYYWYDEDTYSDFESDEEVMADLLENCSFPLTGADVVDVTYKNPGQTFVLAAVAIGSDGKYGDVVTETFQTKPVPSTSDVKVELVSCELDAEGKNYTVTVNVTGATKVMGQNMTYSESTFTSFPVNVAKYGHNSNYYGYQMAEVVDGQAVLTFSKSTYKKDYYVAALNVTDGVVSAVSETCLNIHLFD